MTEGSFGVFFRYDDLAARSWFSPQAGEAQLAILDAFRRAEAPLSAAVIPAAEDDRGTHAIEDDGAVREALCDAVEAGVLEPALHGLSHRDRGGRRVGPSEFFGQSEAEQQAALTAGKRRLEGMLERRLSVFVPPWNAYDSATLRAAVGAGLTIFSASNRPAVRSRGGGSLAWLPATLSLSDLERALEQIGGWSVPPGTLMGVVLHVFDFVESGDRRAWTSVGAIGTMVRRLRDLGARLETIGSIAERAADTLTLRRYRANALAARIAASPRLSFAIDRSLGHAFTSLYWPERNVWTSLLRRCGPLASNRRRV